VLGGDKVRLNCEFSMETEMKICGVDHKVSLQNDDGMQVIVYERLKDCEPSGYESHHDKE